MQFDSTKDHPTIPGGGIINALGSAAKKMVVDWPVAGGAGFARKLAPFAPLDKWESKRASWPR